MLRINVGQSSLVLITVRHADGSEETLRTTDEHPFHRLLPGRTRWSEAPGIAAEPSGGSWTRADALRSGDRLSTLAGEAEVVSIAFTNDRVPVYNLSIPGSPTYFVGERGVWVHNCGAGLHHVIPFYLSGKPRRGPGQVYLSSSEHAKLHKYIDEASVAFGIPTRNNGRRAVETWAGDVGKDEAERALNAALMRAHVKFDQEFQTNTADWLAEELMKGSVR